MAGPERRRVAYGLPRHPDKILESIIRHAEDHGWTRERGRKYYKLKCPCGDHLKTVHITPSENYAKNLRAWLERRDCWEDT